MTPEQPSAVEPEIIETAVGPASHIDEGPKDAPVLVAVHGLPGSVRDFRWMTPCFGGVRVLRPDLPGFGGTSIDVCPDLAPEARASWLVHYLDALKIERCVVLGHSMGGVVASGLVREHQERFAGLVLVSTAGLRRHRLLRRTPVRLWPKLLGPDGDRRALMPLVRTMFRAAGFPRSYSDDELVRSLLAVARTDIAAHARRIRSLTLPTAVVWCEDDPLIESEIFEGLSATAPHGPRLKFAEGGHNPQKAHAVELGDTLSPWIQELLQNPGSRRSSSTKQV